MNIWFVVCNRDSSHENGCLDGEKNSHGVQTFNDEDLGRLDGFGRIQETSNMVVDRLLDWFSVFDSLNLLVHEVEIIGSRVERRHTLHLPPGSVERVVVVQADDSGGVADEGVGVRVPSSRGLGGAAKHAGQPPHEGALAAAGVGGQPYDDCLLVSGGGAGYDSAG